VSTDDEEIALFARRFGAEVLMRPDHLADDAQTLDPVIAHALHHCEETYATSFDFVLTIQPTSPLIGAAEIDRALQMLANDDFETVLSVVDDRHLSWTMKDGKAIPEYSARVNRQFLTPRFRETGAIIACKRNVLVDSATRIGAAVGLLEIEQEKSFDIDTISDFKLCENLLLRKNVVLNVIGNDAVGMGHVYRALMLANELVGHNLVFVCSDADSLAAQFILDRNFQVKVCRTDSVLDTIISLNPNLVVNDVLDTEADFVLKLKGHGISVINFEDLGSGIEHADLVINALYPSTFPLTNVKSGPEYFCLREEFLHPAANQSIDEFGDALLCFGGVDQGNLTVKVLQAIYPECVRLNMHITIVLGAGYVHHAALDGAIRVVDDQIVEVVRSTSTISDYMQRATLAVTSGGRTVLELAALRTPTIVICQNEREETHNFTFNHTGIINLGHRDRVAESDIVAAFGKVATSADIRQAMIEDLAKSDLSKGKQKVMALITEILDASHG
jgi:spore coat polysaccharide biosynthesis predicted glycosyltransferase SpsG